MIEKGEMNKEFDIITLSMDATHNLIQLAKQEKSKKWWSYKLKDWAYNVMVCWI
jgi:hypothetical protein